VGIATEAELPCLADPVDGNDAHAVADFNEKQSHKSRRAAAKILHREAVERGSRFQAAPSVAPGNDSE
jgi:hypothetical protein